MKLNKSILKKKIASRQGITLIEIIVSIALLGIVVVLIGSAMLAGLYMMQSNLKRTKSSMNAGGAVAAGASSGSSAVSASSGAVVVTFGQGSSAISAVIPGSYQTGSDNGGSSSSGGSVGYWSFDPQTSSAP